MKWLLVKLTAVTGITLLVIAAEDAVWTDKTVTTPGALAITGIVLIILASLIGLYVDLTKS